MVDLQDIWTKLTLLRKMDAERTIFGSRTHNYELNLCLTEDEILAVEKRYSITLPEDYRIFLLNVGNGGAGPAYGLFKLGEEDDCFGFTTWERGGLLGDPSQPFIHQDKWNLPDSFWAEEPDEQGMSEEEYEDAYEAWIVREEELSWNPVIMNGAIPICHLGCALRQWLVVSGSEAGNIWCDDRADGNGIYPLIFDGKHRVTFSEWYMQWLDESLRSFQ